VNPWRYLAGLTGGRFVLWCYFIWWVVVLVRYFDPQPRIWMTSAGLSLIIGIALTINAMSGSGRMKPQFWPIFRFFLTPFCVSSFAALVKDRGFVLVFSPRWEELASAAAACLGLGILSLVAKRVGPRAAAGPVPIP